MSQVSSCLRRIFTAFNIFFAVVGGLIIALALLSQVLYNTHGGGGDFEGRSTSLLLLYVLGGVTMVIAILGAFGAHKENKVALIVFLVCMVIGSLVMLKVGVPLAIARPELEGLLKDKLQRVLPLDRASEDIRTVADNLQSNLHCCGLFSYKDWEDQIPDSCLCNSEEEVEGLCQRIQYKNLFQLRSVYTQTCFPIIMSFLSLVADVVLGVVFTLAILALLGVALSSLIIHQMRVPSGRPTMVLTVPAVFAPQPPKYQELYNPPEY
ncbi:tetraspanin-8-like [Centroberyx gerrardi]|uniref:tetraspanin-8-like n=1 Tax=Centroberyx gerrardi TaxID=166262 RepID=UPI003AAF2D43